MRVEKHPILGDLEERRVVQITVNGRRIDAREGETVAAALLANGLRICRHTQKRKEPRGIFCGIGQCTDCVMQVNGVPNVRTCITPVADGMIVETQEGIGKWERDTDDTQ